MSILGWFKKKKEIRAMSDQSEGNIDCSASDNIETVQPTPPCASPAPLPRVMQDGEQQKSEIDTPPEIDAVSDPVQPAESPDSENIHIPNGKRVFPADWRAVETDELANSMPMIGAAEFAAFQESIRVEGQREPIILRNGKILDGRNRYKALLSLNIEPIFEEWDGQGGTPENFVLTANVHRRHLTTPQRAMVAARILSTFKEEAQDRMTAGVGAGPSADMRQGKAVEEAAKVLSVGSRVVEHACKIQQQGIPALIEAVDAGRVAITAASLIADESAERQNEILSGGPATIREAVASLRVEAKKGKRRRKARRSSAPEAIEENGQLTLRVGNRWRAQLSAAMKDRKTFEGFLERGLRIVKGDAP